MGADLGTSETDEAVRLLRELLRWTRGMASPAIRKELTSALVTAEQRRAYELTDGSKSTRAIAKAIGVSHATVGRWHRTWEMRGWVAEVPGSGGKRRWLFSLSELGIPVEPAANESDQTK